MTGNLLDAPDVAKLLGVTPSTIWRWTRMGRLPAAAVVMFGRVARYRRDALIAAGFLTPEPTVVHDPLAIGCPS